MRRRWLSILGILAAITMLVILLMPWWLSFVASALGPRYGVSFGHYSRLGYTRFVANDVVVQRPGVTVRISRVEADTPLVWGWRHLRRSQAPVKAGDWSVEVEKRPPAPPTGPSGWVPLRSRLQTIAATLNRWIPDASTGRGVVRWPGAELSLGSAQWHEQTLTARAVRFRSLTVDASANFDRATDRLTITATDANDGGEARLESAGESVTGHVTWWRQRGELKAQFSAAGWLPTQAEVHADELNLPGERVKLATTYQAVVGHFNTSWKDGKISADVSLRGQPVPGKAAPPLTVELKAHGDTERLTVDALHASIPGGTAVLSAPVTIDRSGRMQDSSARFSLRIDLAQQPWSGARGVFAGDASVVAVPGQTPRVDFTLVATDLNLPGVVAQRVNLAGDLAWPSLHVADLTIVGSAGEQLRAHGTWNVHDQAVSDAAIQGEIARPSVARWIPATVEFDRAAIEAKANGAVKELQHGGRLSVHSLRVSSLRAGTLDVSWQGRGLEVSQFAASAVIGEARFSAEGAADRNEVKLSAFGFRVRDADVLRLERPARFVWHPQLTVEQLRLVGENAAIQLQLEWGASGRCDGVVRGFSSDWITAVMPLRGPAWRIPSLAISSRWDKGPMEYSAAGELNFALPNQRTAAITVSVKGNAQGLRIEALHAVESGNAVVNATGNLPLALSPGHTPLLSISANAPLTLEATTVPNAAFWQQLAAMTGVEVRDPIVQAHLSGTWAEPRGEVTLRIARAAMDPARFPRPLPNVENVDIALSGDAAGIKLDRFSLAIAGQLVRASGRLAVERGTLDELIKAPVSYLQAHSELRVEVPDAQVAMFSRFLPAALAPAGGLQADLRFSRGTLGGSLRLRDAASRPLGPLGVLQQVNADVDFTDHRVILRQVTALSGGQPVTLSGSVELPSEGWGRGATIEPRYDVKLVGKNLPFVRQSGLLVRGDLDLKLATPDNGPPAITGQVVLRDSLFLTDLRAYLPHGGTASPSRRPPYFAVETAPLNTWKLNIDVSGTRFIRIRTPVFAGVASTRFHLGGTLGEPRAIGDAIIDEGVIRMPFAAFAVKQGAVRLTEESPYEPTIYLRGTGRHYGYDLTMEVTGKASAPNINFMSTPALDAEQVLLMVMTGAAPANEVTTSLTHRAAQIGRFFGQSLIGSLSGGSVEPDRLTIESGEKISQQGKETYSIEYKLTDRWSVTGEYDEFDEYNAGFKWRVAPKKLQQ